MFGIHAVHLDVNHRCGIDKVPLRGIFFIICAKLFDDRCDALWLSARYFLIIGVMLFDYRCNVLWSLIIDTMFKDHRRNAWWVLLLFDYRSFLTTGAIGLQVHFGYRCVWCRYRSATVPIDADVVKWPTAYHCTISPWMIPKCLPLNLSESFRWEGDSIVWLAVASINQQIDMNYLENYSEPYNVMGMCWTYWCFDLPRPKNQYFSLSHSLQLSWMLGIMRPKFSLRTFPDMLEY